MSRTKKLPKHTVGRQAKAAHGPGNEDDRRFLEHILKTVLEDFLEEKRTAPDKKEEIRKLLKLNNEELQSAIARMEARKVVINREIDRIKAAGKRPVSDDIKMATFRNKRTGRVIRLPIDAELQRQLTVTQRAEDVIGDRAEALRWMGTPVRALGYATPIAKLKNEAGSKEVMSVLDALEQGVW
jgi:putative toxin-antitoxin system antitoxin component (TIGR02293 family)